MLKDEMPPIEFSQIYPNIDMSPALVDRIEELIKLKSSSSEAYMHSGEKPLMDYIQYCIEEVERGRNNLPGSKGSTDPLNEMLRKYITKYDN